MPTPNKPMVIGAKSTQLVAGTFVIFRNLTRSGKETVEAKSGEAVATPTGWENGDVISIEVFGKYNSSDLVTLTSGSARKSFGTLSADTTTPAINL